jgi:hypothetical protein
MVQELVSILDRYNAAQEVLSVCALAYDEAVDLAAVAVAEGVSGQERYMALVDSALLDLRGASIRYAAEYKHINRDT